MNLVFFIVKKTRIRLKNVGCHFVPFLFVIFNIMRFSAKNWKDKDARIGAKSFAQKWEGKGYEKGESQVFWLSLLRDVFGVEKPEEYVSFEEQVKLDKTSFIDVIISATHVMIEQKGLGKSLQKPIRQSDGSYLTPFQQAKRYSAELPYSERPRWIVTCNFAEFYVYDMENPHGDPEIILLKDLPKEYHRLSFLVDDESLNSKREIDVSVKAGEIVGEIYDALLPEFGDKPSAADLHALNVLCVRLVFCLYAEDAGIFAKEQFYKYLKSFRPENMRVALRELFRVLDTPLEDRDRFMEEKLADFPYVNGSLFHEKESEAIPPISEKTAEILLKRASLDFDWSEISPTIFGAVFESTLNPETRRSGGMHYTSIENIHKVIDPLFLDDLNAEYEKICDIKTVKIRSEKLETFQKKLGSLKFLDPACGSGNFLTETYASLRKLENKCVKLRLGHDSALDVFGEEFKIYVNIDQFYGIEINDFAVNVAKTALWIAENQMMEETAEILQRNLEFLPLKTNATIVEGNALRMDWAKLGMENSASEALVTNKLNIIQVDDVDSLTINEKIRPYNQKQDEITVITREVEYKDPKDIPVKYPVVVNHYDYIMGNPPFVGARMMTQGGEQKKEIQDLFGDIKDVQDLDYVTGWYYKAAELIKGTQTQVAFVSTNSICQGAQVAILWKELFEKFGVRINFAYQTFKWMSESSDVAAVHCIVVGFANFDRLVKKIYPCEGKSFDAVNISPYLFEGPDIFVEARKTPVCDVPKMCFGNQPRDGGHLIVTEEERNEILQREPALIEWIHPYVGAEEFINGSKRYCLWLKNVNPETIKRSKTLYGRVDAVRRFRLNSKAKTTNGYAKVPFLFAQITQPEGVDYLLLPRVSSENRQYIPIGFLHSENISSDAVQIIPKASLYHFGVLTSVVHMAWMRAVAGRLKSDYRYSKEIVYNTFPWCEPTEKQKEKIEETAKRILAVREKYKDCSLASLYDISTMPADLRKAHSENDKAVMVAYGFNLKWLEVNADTLIVAELFNKYQELIKKES